MAKNQKRPQAKISVPPGFTEVLHELKQKIQEARINAAITIQQRLIQLYWEMGKTIFESQRTQKW